jgi:hypothetical protein
VVGVCGEVRAGILGGSAQIARIGGGGGCGFSRGQGRCHRLRFLGVALPV